MKRVFAAIFLLLFAAALGGCMDIGTVVKVKPDGSGTIEEKAMFSKDAVDMITSMEKNMKESVDKSLKAAKDKAPPSDGPEGTAGEIKKALSLYDEGKLKAKAEDFGKGVTYLGSRKLLLEGGEGFEVQYGFPDVNALIIAHRSVDDLGGGGSGEALRTYAMTFQKGAPSKLIIKVPELSMGRKLFPRSDAPETVSLEKQREAFGVFKTLFKGMKLFLAVQAEGTIVETNASFSEGNRVVLIDIDVDKMDFSDEQLEKMNEKKDESYSGLMAALGNTAGFRIEAKNEVWITIR
ncbi:MAG: hypothetical protein RDV48_21550 [Candidatus Eremiobacteraeota bacterium]|nr:hypothetical protein [Candidatus Eremiobacteraeota bacterium]